MRFYKMQITGTIVMDVRVEARDLPSAHRLAAILADNHLMDDGELEKVETVFQAVSADMTKPAPEEVARMEPLQWTEEEEERFRELAIKAREAAAAGGPFKFNEILRPDQLCPICGINEAGEDQPACAVCMAEGGTPV